MFLPFGEYSSLVRAVLRIYFMVALLFVALIGDKCLHLRTKLRLLQGQQVDVTHMTGWLRGGQFLKATWQLRRIPGGLFGFLMISSAIIALVSDLAVSGLVQMVDQPSRCRFEQGLDITGVPGKFPSMQGYPYYVASTSQFTSMYNGGILGIYKRTDNSIRFSAQGPDVVGNWTCDNGSTSKVYSNDLTDAEIGNDLDAAGFLYDVNWQASSLGSYAGSDTTQLVFMSANTDGSTNTTGSAFPIPSGSFDIKFAVDVYDDPIKRQKSMVSYHCSLNDTSHDQLLHKINANINVNSTIATWVGGIQGQLYSGYDSPQPLDGVPLLLTWLLNSMIMVAGSENSVSYKADSIKDCIAGCTEGCTRSYTNIPWPVTLLVSITGFLAAFFFFYTIILYVRVRRACHHYDMSNLANTPNMTPYMAPRGIDSKEIKENTPNGLLDWMRHAVRETGTADAHHKRHHLHKWQFSTSGHGGRNRMSVVNKNFSSGGTAYTGGRGYFDVAMSPNEQNVELLSSPLSGSRPSGSGFFSGSPSPPGNEKRTPLLQKMSMAKDSYKISVQEVRQSSR